MDENDLRFMRVAIGVARKARDKGDRPFGAVLVDERGHLLMEAENTVITEKDCTGHAETNLMRQASRKYDTGYLETCTLYTSTEPCPMCAGAIFWGNVRRVVYGLGQEGLYEMVGEAAEGVLHVPCRELWGGGDKPIEVVGPVLEEEARSVHAGYWH